MEEHRRSFDVKNIRDIVDLYLENEVNNFQNNECLTGMLHVFQLGLDLLYEAGSFKNQNIGRFLCHMIQFPRAPTIFL